MIFLFLLLVFSSQVLFAQEQIAIDIQTNEGKFIRCLTDEKMKMAADQYPELIERRRMIEDRINAFKVNENTSRGPSNVITIPTVVHIIYRTTSQNLNDSRVLEQIQVLNEDFRRLNADANNVPSTFASICADSEIEFCLASTDPSGNPTTGITRTQTSVTNIGQTNNYYSTANGGKTIWDPTKYLNIWVCELGGGLLGFTYTPGGAPNGADGVVIGYQYFGKTGASAPYNQGRTTTHEVGHWLNLEHIWGSGSGGCSNDDGVGDTPMQSSSYSGCPSHPQTTCSSNDMFMNFMDYVNDNCMNSFTVGQKNRMLSAINAARPGLLTSLACQTTLDDAGVSLILTPSGTLCSGTFNPVVSVKNFGSNNLTSFTLNYRIDGGATMTQNWTGNLATLQTVNINLAQQTVGGGSHTFEAFTTQPNGTSDDDPSNDDATSTFVISNGGIALPFINSFELPLFPLPSWDLDNPDGATTWARTTTAAKTGSASIYMDNYDYSANGEIDRLTFDPLDFTGNSSVTMTFELAYALYSSTGYSDTLRVLVSKDCGASWDVVYEKFDNALTTVSNIVTTEFIPTSSQWRQENVDLSAYTSFNDVRVMLEHVTDYENNLYVDDINITGIPSTSVHQIENNLSVFSVFPNPAEDVLNIEIEFKDLADIRISLLDVMGRTVLDFNDASVQVGKYNLNVNALTKGVYFVRLIESDGSSRTKKIIIR